MMETILDRPRIGLLPVVRAAQAALAQGRGFSLVRLGDGEGAMLSHDAPHMGEEIAFCLNIWFGDQAIDGDDRRAMARGLERAMREADVLGLPRRAQLQVSMRYHEVFANLGRVLGARHPVVGDMALHFYLQWSGALGVLVRDARRLVLIGCRDVAGQFGAHFDVPVVQWLLRGEARFPGIVAEPHWPTGYARMMARIEGVGPGDLVLVGAGVLGKAYVAGAARRGAVALDMGSVFDGWVGIISREGRIGTGAEFSIPHLAQGGPADEAMRERLRAYLAGTNIADGAI